MFIITPLVLIFASLAGITIIVWRKKSYLDKLHALDAAGSNTDSAMGGVSFGWMAYGAELFPELKSIFDRIKIHEYKELWLKEAEKFLRKTRLVFLRIDRLSDSLIKKIRKVSVNGQLSSQAHKIEPTSDKNHESEVVSVQKQTISPAFLKNEETRLIMEIAKNPKDASLYGALGDLYVEMESWIDAKESYEASIELDSQNELFKKKLSSVLEKIVFSEASGN